METIVSSCQACFSVQVSSAWYESVFKVIGEVEGRVVCLKCEFLCSQSDKQCSSSDTVTGEMVS